MLMAASHLMSMSAGLQISKRIIEASAVYRQVTYQ